MGDEDLLERMRASKAGWGSRDLDRLYTTFGFDTREGGKHTVYWHPDHPTLRATVGRHRSLAKGYITTAIRLIDRLKAIGGNDAPQN